MSITCLPNLSVFCLSFHIKLKITKADEADKSKAKKHHAITRERNNDAHDRRSNSKSQVDQSVVILQRIAHRGGGVIKQEEEAVGPVDLASPMWPQEIASAPVVLAPDPRGFDVTDRIDDLRAVDDVGEQ